MTNATLKEQLQTLGLSTTSSEKPEKRKNFKPQKKIKTQKPAWLEQAQYGVELLKAHFPLCFKDIKEVQPLKIGIKQDLVKQLSTREEIVIGDKACMVNSLSYYVNSPTYHKRMIEGATRIDLDGNAAGVVTADEANYSAECRKSKLKKQASSTTKPVNSEVKG